MKAHSKFFDSAPWDHLVEAVEAHTGPGSTDREPVHFRRRTPRRHSRSALPQEEPLALIKTPCEAPGEDA